MLIILSSLDNQDREIYAWLQHSDPTSTHVQAQYNYEASTAIWVWQDSKWIDFLAGKHRALFIHGIPGAGKTVLMSYLIEQMKSQCEQKHDQRDMLVFYYRLGSRNQSEAISFLKWLIGQLCRKLGRIPASVSRVKDAHSITS